MKQLLLLLVIISLSTATTHTATTCGQADVQAAIDASSPNDTVYVPHGSATWTPAANANAFQSQPIAICINRGLTLIGGIGGTTTITVSGTFTYGAIQYYAWSAARTNNEKIEIQNFTFDGNSEDHGYGLISVIQYSSTQLLTRVKIHDNIFQHEYHAIVINGPADGVAWGNTFINVGNPFKVEGYDNYSWAANSHNYGTDSCFYFEDNTIYAADSQLYMSDMGSGATGQGGGVVCRYNSYNLLHSDPNLMWDMHGLQSMTNTHGSCNGGCPTGGVCYDSACCNQWASIKAEYYGNKFTNVKGSNFNWMGARGRSLLMFNNLLTGTASTVRITYAQYSCDACQSPASPAYSQHVQNTYVWNNYVNTANSPMIKNLDYCGDNVAGGYVITANRDYYNFNPSFDGTSGIGCGTLANRPATCTAGVGYWATNYPNPSSPPSTIDSMKTYIQAGTFYKATATNTWTAYYQPYTYPHPLRGAAQVVNKKCTITIVR